MKYRKFTTVHLKKCILYFLLILERNLMYFILVLFTPVLHTNNICIISTSYMTEKVK